MSKRTRISDEFEVTAHMIALAKQNSWPDPRKEVEAFKDYHMAKGSLMADWQAAFRTWLRNCNKWAKPTNPPWMPPPVPQPGRAPELKDEDPDLTPEQRRQNVAKFHDLLKQYPIGKSMK